MNASVKRVLQFPVTKIVIGIVTCFSLFVVIQNFVLKPFFYSIIQDKSIAKPIIHCVSIIVLLAAYYYLFRFYEKRKITELSIKYLPKEMFGGFFFGFSTISLSIFILYLLGHYQVIGISTTHYSIKFFTVLILAALVEDLFHRGLIIRICENWLGTNPTLVIGMIVEMQHIFNPNANVFSLFVDMIWGFTMAMMFVYVLPPALRYHFKVEILI